MLEKIDLTKTLSKEDYKQKTEKLKADLARLQLKIKENALPVIVLFEGWSAAGKGGFISDMILTVDPRYFSVHSTVPPTEEELRKPRLWRFWNKLPERGQMAIFDRSWYQDVSIQRVEEVLEDEDTLHRMDSINTFERQLTADGCLIIKFFLHISQAEQKARLDKLEANKATSWRVTPQDRKRNRQYSLYYKAFDEMLEYTDTADAPWHVIPSHDRNNAMAEIYQVLVDNIQYALDHQGEGHIVPPARFARVILPERFPLAEMPPLKEVDLHKSLEREEYKEKLEKEQKKLKKLHNQLYLSKTPVIIVYEGWDAAGKGGNIRRVAAALDPRGYEVVPIAAPSGVERAHQYLWRFWNRLPKTGHIGIFDRSWYGRVMVERIEGFCSEEEWQRAYQEINEFEKELCDWGAVIVKFWLHINQDEQLRRFEDRQNTPEKQWKITDEDWRNREKWPEYENAVDEMIRRTSTTFAPWTIIESQDKKYARIKAIKTLIRAVEQKLGE